MYSKTKRFTYYKNLEKSKLPPLFKIASKIVFNESNIMPTQNRVSKYEAYLLDCDSIGDEVAQELFFKQSMKNGHRQLGLALAKGIGSVADATPKFKALFNSLEQDPVWLDRKKLEYGAHVCRRLGMDAMIALGDLALLSGYANPSISKPLSFTGALKGEKTFDRLNETTQFWLDVTKKGALEIGSKGYQTAVRVRMMHAIVRTRMRQHPKWDSEAWGLPINAADSLATNVAFSTIMILGSSILGTKHSKKDFESVLHLWKYIGFLMGDKIEWLPETQEEALQCVMLIALADNHVPDNDSKQLAQDYLNNNILKEGTLEQRLLGYIDYLKRRAYADFLIPKTIHKRLDLPSSRMAWLFIPIVHIPKSFFVQNIARKIIPTSNEFLDKEGRRVQESYLKRRSKKEAKFQPVEEFAR